jgi:lipopolysaccharide transport system permease protein
MAFLNFFNYQVSNSLELFFILSKRDISVRFKQTALGMIWAIIRPITTMFVFLFAYKNVTTITNISGYPIQIVIYSGILFWNLFANSFQSVSNSILLSSNLISKVYFPRIIILFSAVSVSLIDFIFGLCVYFILAFYFKIDVSFNLILLPVVVLITLFLSIGLGAIFASFSVKKRDFLQIIPIIVQYGFFVTPIVYTSIEFYLKPWFKIYTFINPLVGLVEFFRFTLIDGYYVLSPTYILISVFSSISIFLVGLLIFQFKKDTFVDYL